MTSGIGGKSLAAFMILFFKSCWSAVLVDCRVAVVIIFFSFQPNRDIQWELNLSMAYTAGL